MNPIQMTHRVTLSELRAVGDYTFRELNDEKFIVVWFPAPADLCSIRVQGAETPGRPTWTWNGNTEKPTLNPSVNIVGAWHGWIREGELITA